MGTHEEKEEKLEFEESNWEMTGLVAFAAETLIEEHLRRDQKWSGSGVMQFLLLRLWLKRLKKRSKEIGVNICKKMLAEKIF